MNPQTRTFVINLSIIILFACSPSSDTAAKERVRESVIAGSWYAGSQETLAKQVDDLLDKAPLPKDNTRRIRALIAPHAGYTWSGPCAAYCYKPLKGSNVKRVVVLAPSHHAYFQGGSIADVDAYETPLGKVSLDRESCDALLKCKSIQHRAEAHKEEHSLEIQLPFLQRTLGEFKLIPIVFSEITPEQCVEIADLLKPLLNEETLLVMSSDFTHQGARFQYVPFKKDVQENVQRLDFMAVNHILNLDARGFWAFTDATKATICGRNPIKIGLTALPQQTQVEFLHYETSGDKSNDYSETVSYCAILFRERSDYLDEKETEAMLKTARKTLEQTFKNNKATECNIPEDRQTSRLKEQKGIFVTLQKKGQLRGCIGHLGIAHK